MEASQISGISESIVDEALRSGADDVAVNGLSAITRQVRFSENEIDIFNSWEQTYFQLFLVKQRKVVSTTIKGTKDYRDTIKRAIETADRSEPSEDYSGIASKSSARNYSTRERRVSDSILSGYVREGIDAAISNGGKKSAGSLYNTFYSRAVVTSAGIKHHETGATYYFSIRCFADDIRSGHAVTSSLKRTDFRPEDAAVKASTLASAVPAPTAGEEGRFDTVLDPMVVAALVSQVGSMASAYSVMSGFSCLAGKIGKYVAAPAVNIEDDATRRMYGFRAFDDEGVATRKTRIVANGRLKSYLHNTSTAKKFRTRTTGNAGLISPEPFMLSMGAGRSSRKEMISELRDGLYINNTWYTRYSNYAEGNFSTIPRDAIYRIKRGEITGGWRDIRISENLISLFKRIVDISLEREHLNWWGESQTPCTVPYVTVRKLNITRSSDS
ncbi:MAG: TldD/PmbA family protein [Thermoplasmata archaeon]|uniref:TldD/PmbA family protein n=1 Tax=Candidatus Sysuiplasma superficiale TaxID=2823368 RepID=A0A8J7YI94_9ARCH|nr:TldD/PmbA family protein [Candidatus Sysuiplasma superficiale]MBX8643758.1 TldD/PmbA family protein [Candidatus Sysuiplasma superficiale]MCL4347290.1 TldD/PmbA family protein [Candidatus Thermoplasmatota archaeon]